MDITDAERLAQRFIDQELTAEERAIRDAPERDEALRERVFALERLVEDETPAGIHHPDRFPRRSPRAHGAGRARPDAVAAHARSLVHAAHRPLESRQRARRHVHRRWTRCATPSRAASGPSGCSASAPNGPRRGHRRRIGRSDPCGPRRPRARNGPDARRRSASSGLTASSSWHQHIARAAKPRQRAATNRLGHRVGTTVVPRTVTSSVRTEFDGPRSA
jgi:hypothetical protein